MGVHRDNVAAADNPFITQDSRIQMEGYLNGDHVSGYIGSGEMSCVSVSSCGTRRDQMRNLSY